MKFCPTDLTRVYVASGEGTLTMQSFGGHTPTVLSRTQDCGHDHHNVCYWYCCVDVSVSRQMLVTGDNMGQLLLLGLDGQKIFSNKLHKAKVTHAEFNSRCDWLLATASVDHTVKLWDLRNIKDKKSYLHEMPHERAVNSAYFNPLDSSKLLTTDQYDEIRVYSSCDWSKPQHIIQHPHRQFQHLTPIKATWHPVYDLIVAGRYPDDRVFTGDQRTIDIYDSNTAELVCQLHDPTASGIKSINKFNPMGDVIGSGMGVTVLVWNRNESLISDRHAEQEDTSTSADSQRRQRRSQPRSNRDRRGPAMDAKLKRKLASLDECETKTKTKTKQKQAQMRKK
ncbi:putative DNA damage-binding protein 2 [Scophthalmus maximus]|nr:putative DNA damage-binding protein 2 [Scophthalmus maximus]